MSIYHLNAKIISRGKGQSAVAAAAYRSGQKLVEDTTGEVKVYEFRSARILLTAIMAPDGAPSWVYDRNRLWNEAERAERRKDAQVAREIEVSLPHELTPEQRVWLVKDFVRRTFIRDGFAVDIAIHAPDPKRDQRNFHAHIMITRRAIGVDGFAKSKDWRFDPEALTRLRAQWAVIANEHLKLHGNMQRIDHRSLKDQAIEREPGVHLGYAAREMRQRGAQSNRADDLDGIGVRNRLREDIKSGDQALADLRQITEARRDADAPASHRRLQRDKVMSAVTPEELIRHQAAREAQLLDELRRQEERAQHYILQRQAEADEALKKIEEERKAEDRRAREGDISDAHARYSIALGQAYDIRDPYGSLARAAMVESGIFHKNREAMREQIAKESDPDKRRVIELRMQIEGADYMAITSDRLAGIGVAITGRPDNEQTALDRKRAEDYRAMARELRRERSALIERVQEKTLTAEKRPGNVSQPAKEGTQRGTEPSQKAEEKAAVPQNGPSSRSPAPASPGLPLPEAAEARGERATKSESAAPPPAATAAAREASQSAKSSGRIEQRAQTPVADRGIGTTAPRQFELKLPGAEPTAVKAREQTPPQTRPAEHPSAAETHQTAESSQRVPERSIPDPVVGPVASTRPVAPQQPDKPHQGRAEAWYPEPLSDMVQPSTPAGNPEASVPDRAWGDIGPSYGPTSRSATPSQASAQTQAKAEEVTAKPIQVRVAGTDRLVPLETYVRAMPYQPSQPPRLNLRGMFGSAQERAAERAEHARQSREFEQARGAMNRIEEKLVSGKPIESTDLQSLNRDQWGRVRSHGDQGMKDVVRESLERRARTLSNGRDRDD